MNTPTLPPLLAANPRLDQWVGFPSPGRVTVSTGRVEIGQGVLTAMLQIAAEELDVAPERILLQTGDTDLTPNEGYTAGSQSIQFGGVALRMACAEVRALFLDHAAASHGYSRAELGVNDGAITHRGREDRPRLLVARGGGRSDAQRHRAAADQERRGLSCRRTKRAAR